MILRGQGGESLTQHSLGSLIKKAVSLVWAKSSPAPIPPHTHAHVCARSVAGRPQSQSHVGRMEMMKSRTGEEDHNVAAEHLHPLELRILGLHGSIIHLICCACGIRRAAHWLIEVFPATFSDPQSRASVWPNSSSPPRSPAERLL